MKIGAAEAEAQFSSLLERAGKGEEIIITQHGKSIARLVAVERQDRPTKVDVVSRLKELRRNTRLDGITWRELRDEGRR